MKSEYGPFQNTVENIEKLEFARAILSKEQFVQLHKSYKQLFWFQMIPYIMLVIGIILIILFVPALKWPTEYDNLKFMVLLLWASVWVIFLFVWLILSQFIIGKLWLKYHKWYNGKGDIDELYALFKN